MGQQMDTVHRQRQAERNPEATAGSEDNQHQDGDDNDQYVFFWEEQDIFSQWHRSIFELDDLYFICVEQYVIYMKADAFGNSEMKRLVMEADHPRRMKALDRQLTGRGHNEWDTIHQEIVRIGNMAKFSQNSDLKEALFSTYPKILVQASPHDTIWGIGLEETDPRAHDQSTWQGQNLLGYLLTEVRDELMCREGLISEEQRMIFPRAPNDPGPESFIQEEGVASDDYDSDRDDEETDSDCDQVGGRMDSDCDQVGGRMDSDCDQVGGRMDSDSDQEGGRMDSDSDQVGGRRYYYFDQDDEETDSDCDQVEGRKDSDSDQVGGRRYYY